MAECTCPRRQITPLQIPWSHQLLPTSMRGWKYTRVMRSFVRQFLSVPQYSNPLQRCSYKATVYSRDAEASSLKSLSKATSAVQVYPNVLHIAYNSYVDVGAFRS